MANRLSLRALRRKADALFAAKVRARGSCQRCGRTDRLQCAHIVPRRYLAVRWDEDNALCLCSGCHVFFTHFPLEFEEWVRATIGSRTYEELRHRAMAGGRPDYLAILSRLEADA